MEITIVNLAPRTHTAININVLRCGARRARYCSRPRGNFALAKSTPGKNTAGAGRSFFSPLRFRSKRFIFLKQTGRHMFFQQKHYSQTLRKRKPPASFQPTLKRSAKSRAADIAGLLRPCRFPCSVIPHGHAVKVCNKDQEHCTPSPLKNARSVCARVAVAVAHVRQVSRTVASHDQNPYQGLSRSMSGALNHKSSYRKRWRESIRHPRKLGACDNKTYSKFFSNGVPRNAGLLFVRFFVRVFPRALRGRAIPQTLPSGHLLSVLNDWSL